ncbi:MAG: hypothetical protein KQH83_01025 [Actinobacteria bacterium]|nr:hypothetical protein [Actinomycetota bacterium]
MTADWGAFYRAVCASAGSLLTGLDDEAREAIAEAAGAFDVFWSVSMLDTFTDFAPESTRTGVELALEVWRENVLEAFGDLLDLDPAAVGIDPRAIGPLVAAAEGEDG